MNIGIDIEKVEKFVLDRNDGFIRRNFSEEEVAYAFSKTRPEIHLCGIFCAKEAAIKTNNKLGMDSVNVRHDSTGAPVLIIEDEYKYLLSISHCEDYATAVVLRLENDRN